MSVKSEVEAAVRGFVSKHQGEGEAAVRLVLLDSLWNNVLPPLLAAHGLTKPSVWIVPTPEPGVLDVRCSFEVQVRVELPKTGA